MRAKNSYAVPGTAGTAATVAESLFASPGSAARRSSTPAMPSRSAPLGSGGPLKDGGPWPGTDRPAVPALLADPEPFSVFGSVTCSGRLTARSAEPSIWWLLGLLQFTSHVPLTRTPVLVARATGTL